MSKLAGVQGQSRRDYLYRADVVMMGQQQLVLPMSPSRCLLLLQNNGQNDISIEIGCGTAAATLGPGGTVASIAVTNGGFNFTLPPHVTLIGGGGSTKAAKAVAYLTSGSISSIAVSEPGLNYKWPPYVLIENDPGDPFGVAAPVAGNGIILLPYLPPIAFDCTACPTEPISALGSAGDVLCCRWMD